MPRRSAPAAPVPEPSADAAARGPVPLEGLGIAGLTRWRITWVAGGVLAAWVLVSFAGQVSEAASASARVAEQRTANATLRTEVEALQQELATIADQRWILQQARAYQLGGREERAFRIAPDTPSLPPDAPGSAATRVGATVEATTPLESWLEVLFGPAPGTAE